MKTSPKIGFLYLDNDYNVYHSISLAIYLGSQTLYSIEIFTIPRNKVLIDSILDYHNSKNIVVTVLSPLWGISLPIFLEIKLQFRKLIFLKYKKTFESFDILVSTIFNDIELKRILNNQTKFLFTAHGTANRKYAFKDAIKMFDFFFIKGDIEEEIRKRLGHLDNNNYFKIGYLKYELLKNKSKRKFFSNEKQTVLYNPHWDKKMSSFYDIGYKILDHFLDNKEYNLIFAPHSYLMSKSIIHNFRLKKYSKAENIIVDYTSDYKSDMSYTNSADIYLGDVSSQAWEFVISDLKPCLFLDLHKLQTNSELEFLSWELGTIVDNVENLSEKLKEAKIEFNSKYIHIQQEKVNRMYLQDDNPVELAANAINEILAKMNA